MALFRRLLRWVGLAEVGVGVVLLGAIVCLIFYQVAARYLFGAPEAWIEELCTYAFIWLVFLGAGAAMKLDRHIRVTSLEARAGPRAKAALRWLGALVTIAALATTGFHAAKFFPVELRSSSVALPVNFPRAFFFSLPLLWACASVSLSMLYVLLRDLREINTGEKWPPLFAVGGAAEAEESHGRAGIASPPGTVRPPLNCSQKRPGSGMSRTGMQSPSDKQPSSDKQPPSDNGRGN